MAFQTEQCVHDILEKVPKRGLDALKELFWTELNYKHAHEKLSIQGWPSQAVQALAEPPLLLAQAGGSGGGGFSIVYSTLSDSRQGSGAPLSIVSERLVINQLLKNHPYALFVFSDEQGKHWHLVNVRLEEAPERQLQADAAKRRRVFRRITLGPDERLRTATERIVRLNLATMQGDLLGSSPLEIQRIHDEAFDVEQVTKAFYADYEVTFNELRAELQAQTGDRRWAHAYSLQFLNRLMFLYFVQRKRWLGDDPDFVTNLWRAYRGAGRPEDSFVNDWLHVLFFEAFNKRFQAGRSDRAYLPQKLREALQLAPWLNGGLFARNRLDREYEAAISDARFEQIHAFLERYNFTIHEDTPLDQEVAVDPEMLGKVYETLVHVAEQDKATADEGGAGIFYTPRVEIDLMCRLALVDWLANHLGDANKRHLVEAIFAVDPDEKEDADETLSQHNLWPMLNNLLRDVTVLEMIIPRLIQFNDFKRIAA